MPAIGQAARSLISDARLSSADVSTLRNQVGSGQASVADVQALATHYVDALEAGVGDELFKLLNDLGAGTVHAEPPLQNLAAEPGLLNGLVRLPHAGRKHAAVHTVQRALMALASRTGESAFMLPNYGSDGDYGTETQDAVKAFQQKNSLAVTGEVDLHTAQKLDQQLRHTRVPAIFAGGAAPTGPGPQTLIKAAQELIAKRADNFGVPNAWWNNDPRHSLPANVSLGGLKGKWKCNLFAGNALVSAGFEPPYYNNGGRGEYPNANQFWKWSDKHAARFGNKDHVRFELLGELDVQSLQGQARRDAIEALLKKAEPGDMIFVDHMGTDVADGGHCRVVVENKMASDGTLPCAQASQARAMVKDETISSFTGEEFIWLLKPNVKRPEGAAKVT